MERIHLINMDIILDGDTKTFQAGEKIGGILKIAIKGKLRLSSIKIGLVCKAEVNWVEKPGTRYHRDGHVYQDKKNFLDYWYEMPEQYANKILEDGEHVIPFKFKLPEEGIPSTFESPHGSVTYYVEALIEEADETHRVGKEVIVETPSRENLNLSVSGSTEKDLGLLCFGSGKVTLFATVAKKGIIPGELIEVSCCVENMSSVDVTPRATLYQTQVYMSGERHKALEIALTEAVIGSKVEKETNSEETLSILLPKEASLSIKSPIISIKYFVHLTLDIPYAIDLHLNLPIIVTNKRAFDQN